MAIYIIIRLYRVPGRNQVEATDRMAEAVRLHVEGDYHVRDVVKSPGDKEEVRIVHFKPDRGWIELLKKQLGF
jgi:hypothetical protein